MAPQRTSSMDRATKKYTFHKVTSSSMIKAFGLEENTTRCREVKAYIRNCTREHIKVDATISKQSNEALLKVEEKLKNKYPDVFNHKKHGKMRLGVAKCYMTQVQSARRWCANHGQDVPPKAESTHLPPSTSVSKGEDVVQTVPPQVSDVPRKPKRNSSISKSSTIETKSIDVPYPSPPSVKSTSYSNSRFTAAMASSPAALTSSPAALTSSPAALNSSPTALTSSPATFASNPPTNNTQVAEVHTFLKSCVPPMGHFLQRFLQHGIRNEQYLRGVSTWSKEDLEEMLRALPTLGGRDMTEMDIGILRVHFKRYFI